MKPIYLWLAVWLLCVAIRPSWATVMADDDDLVARQMAVRELMRLDTALAIEQTRKRMRRQDAHDQSPPSATTLSHSGALKLMAIYGVGKKLLAEVRIGQHTHVYLRGQPLAVGAKAGSSTYLLKGINGSCVHLEREGEGHTLCLDTALGLTK